MNNSWPPSAPLQPSVATGYFPGLLGQMAQELGGVGIDGDIATAQLIAVTSLLTQGIADVSWPNGQSVPVGGNSLLVAPSGGGKSVLFRILMEPISSVLAEVATAGSEHSATPAFFIEDATREALLDHLSEWPVAGLFTDEAGQLKQLLGNAAPTLAKLLDGAPLRHARVSTGRIELIGHRVTMLLMEQPQIFEASKALLGVGSGGVGLINRFFVAAAQGLQAGASLHRVGLSTTVAQRYACKVNDLLESTIKMVRSKTARPILQLSSQASEFFAGLNDEIQKDQVSNPGLVKMAEYASRHSERTLRFAGALHVFEHGVEGLVQLPTLQAANHLGRWSLDNFLQLTYEPPRLSQAEQDAMTLAQALDQAAQSTGGSPLRLSELRRCAPNIGLTKSRFERALPILARQGKVTVVPHGNVDWLTVHRASHHLSRF